MAPDKDKSDYGIEYEDIVDMVALKPGRINWWEATEDMIREVAASYDPDLLRAPIVLDHIMEGPAFGHVLELKVEDEKDPDGDIVLMAKVGLLPAGKEMIESGGWNERSVYLSDTSPTPGIYYLKHLSLLGAANPASAGMAPVVMFPDEEAMEEAEAAHALPGVQQIIAAERSAAWEKSEESITYRVRPANRFQSGTLRTVTWDAKKGINAIIGKLQKKYIRKGSNANALVAQSILFSLSSSWTMTKSKNWITAHKEKLQASFKDDIVSQTANAEGGNAMSDSTATAEETAAAEAVEAKAAAEKAAADLAAKQGAASKEVDGQSGTTSDANAASSTDQSASSTGPAKTIKQLGAEEDEAFAAQRRLDAAKADAEDEVKKYNARMAGDERLMHFTRIRTKVQNLLASGFLVPAQIEAGLIKALCEFPLEAKVDNKPAVDVILECLTMSGKLMLKDQIAEDLHVDRDGPNHDLDSLEASTSLNVTGIEVERRRRELMAKDEKLSYVEALRMAQEEVVRAGGEV